MKLIVGLGNPGRQYEGTRHNVGFSVIEELSGRYSAERPKQAFRGETLDAQIDSQKVLFLCPHTLMNLSGGSVLAARDFYRIEHQDLLIVCDDFNLPLGKLRMRPQGSAGGQKGLEDIIRRLGNDEIPRLRIGIGPVPPSRDAADFVLGKFTKAEKPDIAVAVVRAADAVSAWVRQGMASTMNQFN